MALLHRGKNPNKLRQTEVAISKKLDSQAKQLSGGSKTGKCKCKSLCGFGSRITRRRMQWRCQARPLPTLWIGCACGHILWMTVTTISVTRICPLVQRPSLMTFFKAGHEKLEQGDAVRMQFKGIGQDRGELAMTSVLRKFSPWNLCLGNGQCLLQWV